MPSPEKEVRQSRKSSAVKKPDISGSCFQRIKSRRVFFFFFPRRRLCTSRKYCTSESFLSLGNMRPLTVALFISLSCFSLASFSIVRRRHQNRTRYYRGTDEICGENGGVKFKGNEDGLVKRCRQVRGAEVKTSCQAGRRKLGDEYCHFLLLFFSPDSGGSTWRD